MKARIYLSIFITYLFTFLYPLAFGQFSYYQVINVVKNDSQKANISALEKCCDIIDGRLLETKGLTDQISGAASTSSLVYSKNPETDPRNIIKMMDFRDTLKSYLCSNNFIQDVFVYFKGPDIVVGTQETFLNYDQFYNGFLQYSDMSPGQWNNMIQNLRGGSRFLPSATIKRFQRTDQMMIYIKGFPDYTGSMGAIVTLIPEVQLKSTIKDTYLEEHGCFEIIDTHNNIVLSYSNGLDLKLFNNIKFNGNSGHRDLAVDGKKYLLSYTTSPSNGWKYMGILPYSAVMKKADGLHRVAMLGTILCIITGFVLIFLLSTKKSQHIMNLAVILINKLNVPYRGRNRDIKLIDQSLTGLIDDNESMKNNIQLMLPMLRNTFVEKLLKREFSSDEEIRWALSQFGLSELEGKKIVVCVKIDSSLRPDIQSDLLKFNTAKVLIEDYLHKAFSGFYSYNASFDSNAYILKLVPARPGDPEKYLDGELDKICRIIYETYDISLFFSVGTVFESLIDASDSYNAANIAMDNNILENNKNVLWYKNVKPGKDSFYYPIDHEIQFINSLKEGNFSKVKYILDNLYRENYVKRDLSYYMSKSLINNIYSTLIKTNNMLNLDAAPDGKLVGELIIKIERKHNTVERIFEEYRDICAKICVLVDTAKNINITSRKIDTIVKYIEQNFSDLDMNLTTVANKFGFAPPYLSKIFKENTGENFSVYLENLRIKKGCELLSQCGNIEEVARKIGYNSTNAFRKAFKHTMNVTPSEYRFQQRQMEKY